MANHKSAEKRARQTKRRTTRNLNVKNSVRTFEKKVKKAIAAKSPETAELLKTYTSQIMKAVSKGVVKKQSASRKISRVASAVASQQK